MTNHCSALMTAKAGKEDKMKTLAKIIAVLISVAVIAFGAIQAVYWLNLDNKFMFLLYKVLEKHYDNVPRDRKF